MSTIENGMAKKYMAVKQKKKRYAILPRKQTYRDFINIATRIQKIWCILTINKFI